MILFTVYPLFFELSNFPAHLSYYQKATGFLTTSFFSSAGLALAFGLGLDFYQQAGSFLYFSMYACLAPEIYSFIADTRTGAIPTTIRANTSSSDIRYMLLWTLSEAFPMKFRLLIEA